MLTTAQNNSNCADSVGKAFEMSGACGGVRILRNANIISRGGEKERKKKKLYFQKEQNWNVIKLSSILEANTRLNF